MINPPPIQGDTLTETAGGRIRRFSAAWQQWFSAAQAVLQGVANYGVGSVQPLPTGFSVQFPQDTGILLIKSAAQLASGTVTLPASPVDRQQVTIAATQGVKSLAIVAASGQSVVNAPTSLGAGSAVSYWFSEPDAAWYVISGGTGSASGGVSSVGLVMPSSVFTVANTPVTANGTLTAAFVTQVAGKFLAGPATGADAVPAFRAIALSDIAAVLPAPSAALSYLLSGDGSLLITQDGLELTLD